MKKNRHRDIIHSKDKLEDYGKMSEESLLHESDSNEYCRFADEEFRSDMSIQTSEDFSRKMKEMMELCKVMK